jgi:hypothetical protein
MTEADNIFRRWARLKHASKVVRAADAAPDRAVATATQTEVETTDDAPFDLASLPSIESIAADSDIVAFLRSEVPTELTRAALRRAWISDPAIRDFIGIAENQWDFNDPAAIPGFGPLTAMEDSSVGALMQVSSRLEEAIEQVTSPGDPTSSFPVRQELSTADVRPADSMDKDISNEMPEATPEQGENQPLEDCQVSHKCRRHGGALPR